MVAGRSGFWRGANFRKRRHPVTEEWSLAAPVSGPRLRQVAVMARAPEPPQARRRPVHARRHRTTVITDAEKASRDAPSRR